MFVEKSITAENQFTDQLQLPALTDPQKKTAFNLSIFGGFVATITVQRSFDGGSTWLDTGTFSSPDEFIGEEIESSVKIRAGVKTGDFTSGQVDIRLGVN